MTDRSPRMHADEVDVDDMTVRRLLSEQFPQWADQDLRRWPDSGTDSAIYRLGGDLGIRMPRIHWAVRQIDQEWRWLRTLAPGLPVAIPVPVAKGEAGTGYPYPWLIYPWIEGTSLDEAEIDHWSRLAADVATFVLALEKLPTPAAGPAPRRRGGPLATVDHEAKWAIRHLEGVIDVDHALDIWQTAIDVGDWSGPPVWIHGDLLSGNVLVRRSRLSGVIDWSGLAVGDPACDAMFAWCLPAPARMIYRRTLNFDSATWARARGWVIEQTALYIPYYERTLPSAVAQAKERLHAALWDPED